MVACTHPRRLITLSRVSRGLVGGGHFAVGRFRVSHDYSTPPPPLPFLDAFGRDEDVGRKDSFFSINDITGREESVCDRRNEGTFLESIGRFRGKNWINP